MPIVYRRSWVIYALLFVPFVLRAQAIKIITNHVGYETRLAKRAMVLFAPGGGHDSIHENTREGFGKGDVQSFWLLDAQTGKVVYQGFTEYSGAVNKWKDWQFRTIDFSACTTTGEYRLQVDMPEGPVYSYPFLIGTNVLEKATLSDLVYYFKGQRCAGLFDQADRRLALPAADSIDLHGGWYDATGDYGKHLSHLTFSTWFNPQQIPLTVWGLLKTNELLSAGGGKDFRQINRRVLDEALYGADYLARSYAKGGSFYRSVGAPGPGKLARDRYVQAEEKSYRIKVSKDQTLNGRVVNDNRSVAGDNWRGYQVSYRSGGGMAIAALAMAAARDTSGEYSRADYLRAAEHAFLFLEKENALMTNDGQENIIDDYCALSAATELYKTTKKEVYLAAAEKRAIRLAGRLHSWKGYVNYWRADNADRPFFHPADAGLPVVSLLYYYPYASGPTRLLIRNAVKLSMQYELSVTHEVNNPFGYSRQLVQDTLGRRQSSFFFPQGSEASPWWQGENARLGSMATAARMAAHLYSDDKVFRDSLEKFALDQLNWILGLNPYDACMLQGTGHNNPSYGFFGTTEYTNAPGGIVNGITSGLDDEGGIDFNLAYAVTGKDYDWRWAEQWLPHATWFMLAIAEP